MNRIGTGVLAFALGGGLGAAVAAGDDVYTAIVLGPKTATDPTCELKWNEKEVHASSGDTIYWVIVNHCNNEKTVSLENFRTGGTSASPSTSQPQPKKPKSHKKEEIDLKVKNHSGVKTTYTADLKLEGQVVDPVIVIEK